MYVSDSQQSSFSQRRKEKKSLSRYQLLPSQLLFIWKSYLEAVKRSHVLKLNILHWAWEIMTSWILFNSQFLSNFVIVFNHILVFAPSPPSFPPSPLPFVPIQIHSFLLLTSTQTHALILAIMLTYHYLLITTLRMVMSLLTGMSSLLFYSWCPALYLKL